MHRTEGANYASGHLFTDGPPGTTVTDDWLNAVQEEFCYIIEQAGMTVKTAATETRTQLREAVMKTPRRCCCYTHDNNLSYHSGLGANSSINFSTFKYGTGLSVCVSTANSWEFTADKSMILKVGFHQRITPSAGNVGDTLYGVRNGSFLRLFEAGLSGTYMNISVWTSVILNPGDVFNIRFPGSADGGTLNGTDEYNQIYLEEN